MLIASSGPFRSASLIWTPPSGGAVLTVVCKATFQLRLGESVLVADPDLPNEEDNHWNDEPSRSVYSPCDLVPFKRRADVMLVGSAFTPRGQPMRSILVRLLVGDVDKSIEVFADRAFTRDGRLREGPGFSKMTLRWERAAGGPDTGNPVGIRGDGPPDAGGNVVVPNLQPPGLMLDRPGDYIAPIGFGPVAPTWPERLQKLGRHAGAWPHPGWTERPMPEDIDQTYFNAAPRDQQLDQLRDGERILLENLHPEHPRLATSLPRLRPQALLDRPGKATRSLEMRADTLWIDTDRGLCTLTWRGQAALEHRSEAVNVRIGVAGEGHEQHAPQEQHGQNERLGQHERLGHHAQDDSAKTMVPVPHAGAVMPFMAGRPEDSPMAQAPTTMILSSADIEEISVDEEPGEMGGEVAVQTLFLAEPRAAAAKAATPFVPAALASSPGSVPAPMSSAPSSSSVPSAPAVPPLMPIAPPMAPHLVSLAPVEMGPPPMAPPPMASPPMAPMIAPQRAQSVGERAAAQAASPNVVPIGGAAIAGAMPGLLDASNAAAGREPRRPELEIAPAAAPVVEPRPKPAARDVLKLLWFDPKSVARIRKHTEWRVLLAELELRLLDEGDYEDDEADEAAGDEPKPKDRRDVFEVLAKARPIGAEGVRLALSEAISDDGKFEPPLVLLAGELELPFDELATLRATAAAVSPFALSDKKLKEQLDVVEELLKTPWLQGSGSIAKGLTDKIEDAFAQGPGKRTVGPEYIAAHTERMLLEQRCYQMRTVFGKKWIRSVLGGSGVPVYVPEALKDELPMFKRVKVKLIGEVDMQEDQFEAGGAAIKVVALGRMMG